MNDQCYVYRLTDVKTGKYYVGSSYKKDSKCSDLGTSYFTSSKVVRKLWRSDPTRFQIEILYTGLPDDVLKFETETLRSLDARRDPMSYNCHNNETNVNSRKIGELTRELMIGVHGRSPEQMKSDASKAGRISCEVRHAEKDHRGKSKFASQIGSASHMVKDERGKSARMVEVGKKTMAKLHQEKDENGKSKFTTRKYKCAECEFTNMAMMVGKHQKSKGHRGKIPL